jgi:hypothetical protein
MQTACHLNYYSAMTLSFVVLASASEPRLASAAIEPIERLIFCVKARDVLLLSAWERRDEMPSAPKF